MMIAILLNLLLALTPSEALQKATEHYDNNQYQEAILTLTEEMPSIRAANDADLLGEALSVLSCSYFRLGIFDKAIDAQKECYDIDVAAGDSVAISSSLNNLAALYLATKDYKMAEKLIREAIRYEEPLGNSEALAIRYGMAADVLVNRGKAVEAEEYARKALALDTEAGREGRAAARKSQLAAALIEQNKLDEATALLSEAYPVFDREKNINSLAICRNQQGIIARKEGFENLAANYLREAKELSEKVGNKYLQQKVTQELASLLRTSDPAEAARYLQEYAVLTDSIFQEKTAEQLTEFKVKTEVEKKDQEILVKEQEVEILKNERLLLVLVTVLLGLALILTIIISTLRKKNLTMLQNALHIKEKIIQIGKEDTTPEKKHERMNEVIEDLDTIREKKANHTLTEREKEIANLCCQGMITKEIAFELGLSTRTVETHKNNIFRKLGIHTTEELIEWMNGQK